MIRDRSFITMDGGDGAEISGNPSYQNVHIFMHLRPDESADGRAIFHRPHYCEIMKDQCLYGYDQTLVLSGI